MSLRSLKRSLYYEYYKVIESEQKEKEKALRKKRKISYTLSYLKKNGLIELSDKENLRLTPKGVIKLIVGKSAHFKKSRSNSKGDFLIIFDIPEEIKAIRNLFRRVLYNFQAELLQKSVFSIKDRKAFDYLKDLAKEAGIKDYVIFISEAKRER